MSQTIPTSVRARIQKLLALANDARGNEHEAVSAAAKVQALLAEYNLEMSAVAEESETSDVDREKAVYDDTLLHTWQVDLFASVASNNFCLHTRDITYLGNNETKVTYSLIGRALNVATTRRVFEYLTRTMERVNPITDRRRAKARRSWFEGCASRLSQRLYEQRQASEMESRQARDEGPRGNGSDLVLSDVYSSEEDLNRDFRWGYEAGTTARERAENNAKWEAGRGAREARYAAEKAAWEAQRAGETEAGRVKREAAEKAGYERSNKRWDRERKREANKRDADAYAMGDNAGRQIGLDAQIS